MSAVYKHEVSSYFTNVTGYVFGAFLLLFAGIYMMAYNLRSAYTNFEYVLGGMSFVFLVTVPILTMKIIAEEKRQRTDQLLYSLPMGMTEVVLGKYLALLTVFALPVLIICVYPLVLRLFGNVWLPAAYSAVLGFYLLGAALIAIGMFISSITESQAVAAGLCFVVMLLNYFITSLASFASSTASGSLLAFTVLVLLIGALFRLMTRSGFASIVLMIVLEGALLLGFILDSSAFEGLFPEVMEQLSLFDRFYGFIDGVFDLRSVVYFLSVAAVFVFLSVQSLEKRRWSDNMTTYEKEEGDIDGPFALAVAVTETLDDGGEAELIWVSSAYLLDDATNQGVSGGNEDFFLNCLNWLCGSESGISIHAKSIGNEYLTITSGASSMLTALVVVIIPAAFLAFGIVVWYRRKKR